MNTNEATQFFQLKDSISTLLQQQQKTIQICINSCQQITGKYQYDMALIQELIESSYYLTSIQKSCLQMNQQLKKLISQVYPRLFTQYIPLEQIKPVTQNITIPQITEPAIPIIQNMNEQNERQIRKRENGTKDVFGCLRYPFEYYGKAILGFQQPFMNIYYLKEVPQDMLERYRDFKLEEFSKFEQFSGLALPEYFKSEEFFFKNGNTTRPYQLSLQDQKAIYNMYQSQFFSSYSDIATFFALSSARGISSQIQSYEQYLYEQTMIPYNQNTQYNI